MGHGDTVAPSRLMGKKKTYYKDEYNDNGKIRA